MKEEQPIYCAANQGNQSGHARGRKLHLTIDKKKSVCNMKYERLNNSNEVFHMAANGQCKVCFGKYPEMKLIKSS